jgi:putative chitinase
MSPITAAQLSQLFPDADNDYLGQVAVELNTDPSKYGLDTPLRCAHFFAQVMQEAGPELQAQVENLNYSPKALEANFSYYRNRPTEAVQDGYAKDPNTGKIVRPANQQRIANNAYANRIGNGDAASGDGWRFRGRGFIQITGRANYAALATTYGTIYGAIAADFVANPDEVANFPYSLRSAVCFWVQHGLPALADHGSSDLNVDAITAVINKDTPSYGERRDNFHQAIQVFQ